MEQSPIDACLAYIRSEVSPEILELVFNPVQNHTTVEELITENIIRGIVLQDVNLLGGRRKIITMQETWKLDVPDTNDFANFGTGIGASFYRVPEHVREGRDITQVIGISNDLANIYAGDTLPVAAGMGGGTRVSSALTNMLNSYTRSRDSVMPQATKAGANIVKFFPKMIVSGVAVAVLLSFDPDFNNMQTSAIKALRNLVLCATKRYISRFMRVKVDEFYAAAGMEIGVVRTIIDEYTEDSKEYDNLLIRCKGAMMYDMSMLDKEIYYRI